MAETTKHTPTPWMKAGHAVYALNNQRVPTNRMSLLLQGGWTDKAGERTSLDELEANAGIIVRAVNSHDALLAACKGLMRRMKVNELLGKDDSLGKHDQAAYDAAKEAITLASKE